MKCKRFWAEPANPFSPSQISVRQETVLHRTQEAGRAEDSELRPNGLRYLFFFALAWATSWRASVINQLAVSIKVRDCNTSDLARSWLLHVRSYPHSVTPRRGRPCFRRFSSRSNP